MTYHARVLLCVAHDPEMRLRDIAASLLSGVRVEQRSVSDADLIGLNPQDATILIAHLGRAARDRPTEQTAAVQGILRLVRIHLSAASEATNLLNAIPAGDVQPAVPLLFTAPDLLLFRTVLERWSSGATGPTSRALQRALTHGGH